MKTFLIMIVVASACGCILQPVPNQASLPNEALEHLLSRTRSVIVCGEEEPQLITNKTGQVLFGSLQPIVGTVTSRPEIAAFTAALSETGTHGNSGVSFCGALPGQVFLDENGAPLVGALVHLENNHVILFTNLTLIKGQLYYTQPTGEVFGTKSWLPSGNNPPYGLLASQLVERIWPQEMRRIETERHNHAPEVTPHKLGEHQR